MTYGIAWVLWNVDAHEQSDLLVSSEAGNQVAHRNQSNEPIIRALRSTKGPCCSPRAPKDDAIVFPVMIPQFPKRQAEPDEREPRKRAVP